MKRILPLFFIGLCCQTASAIDKAPVNHYNNNGADLKKVLNEPWHQDRQWRNSDMMFQNFLGKIPTTDVIKKNEAMSKRYAPQYLAPKGGSIYGYEFWSWDNDAYPGLYEITESGYEFMWMCPLFNSEFFTPYNGWYVDGKINGVSMRLYTGEVGAYYSYSIDFETGKLLDLKTYDIIETAVMFDVCTLNTDDNKIYGFAVDFDQDNNYFWTSAYANSPLQVKEIKAVTYDDLCLSLCYNPEDGNFYGVTTNGRFVRISPDGTQTLIKDLEMTFNQVVTGMVWDSEAGLFYWNVVNPNSSPSFIYTLTQEGEISLEQTIQGGTQFSYLVSTNMAANENKPALPEIVSIDFKAGSLSGSVTYKMPSVTLGGAALSGELEYTALLDDETVTTGKAKAGENVTVQYNVAASGYHIFSLYVTSNGENSVPVVGREYIGTDTPSAPGNVVLTNTEISWEAVTTGINGAYINTADITYIVYMNNEEIGTTKETTYKVTLPENTPLESYRAAVAAECDGLTSALSYSNEVFAGESYYPPIYFAPTEQEFDFMSLIDANGDGSGWYFAYNYGLMAEYTDDPSVPMDDYIFLPPIYFIKETTYNFSLMSALVSLQSSNEMFDVVYANSPTVQSIMGTIASSVKPTVDIKTDFNNWSKLSEEFTVPYTGDYYIGLHCVSPGFGYGLAVRDIRISEGSSPKGVTGLSAIAGENGALEATVTFTMPTETVNGDLLSADAELEAEIYVNGDVANYVNGKPGEMVSAQVATQQGLNDLTVVVYYNNVAGNPVTSMVYTGVDLPATPENIRLTMNETMMGATLEWDPVTTAANEGGYVDPAGITYSVFFYVGPGANDWMFVEGGLTSTTLEVYIPSGAPQGQYAWAVTSSNEAGSTGEYRASSVILGSPYELPFETTFSQGGADSAPWLRWAVDGTYGAQISYRSLASVNNIFTEEDGYALVCTNVEGYPVTAMINMPCFTTTDMENVVFSMDYLTGTNSCEVEISARIYGSDERIVIGTIPADYGTEPAITTFTFQIPESLLGQGWVMPFFRMKYASADDLFVVSKINITGEEAGITSAVSYGSISGGKGKILVKGHAGELLTIVSIDGKTVVREVVEREVANFEMAPGIYIVNSGSSKAKVLVK